MLLEYKLDWIKIVDFLLIAKFWAFLLFFIHPLSILTFLFQAHFLKSHCKF